MKKENEIKKVAKEKRKVFTKKESNNIIKKDYDPLKVNYKIYEREGLFMKGTKNVVLDVEMKELIINKEDFKKFFNERKIINQKEYKQYLKQKNNT